MNKILPLLLIAAFSTAYSQIEILEDKSELVIETPALQEIKTRKLRLENGLEAFLISDPQTPKSGAALAVHAGSWDDPKENPGMAHFVEHLLFLGTEKYPEEESYTRYLNEHNGTRNAFTMADRTVYMFSVNNEGFSESLDRFGQFFISPLFHPSGVKRESKAIHQEFCKDVPLDPWRVLYVKKELANKEHPFHAFCIGNLETIGKISQEDLKRWYNQHYSANIMKLVVYSPLDLDILEKEIGSLFSQVKNKKCKISQCESSLFTAENFANLVAIAPLQNIQHLELSWELPRFFGNEKEIHADKLISHVLGHEGSTSLLTQLKKENLAQSLSIGNIRAGKDQCLLTLTVGLTSEGVKEYEKVIERCFQAISSLKQSGIPKYIYDEVRQLEEARFRYQSRQDVFHLVTEYAAALIDEPIETFPKKTLLASIYSPEVIQDLLAHMSPQNCQFTLIAEPSLSKMTPTIREKWLGVNYCVIPITEEKIHRWSALAPHDSICIPRPNPFIPEKFTVELPSSTGVPKPKLIANSVGGKFYSCQDRQYSVPEICFSFKLKTPEIADNNPKSLVLADLFCHAVNEAMNETAYEASVAGLSYSLKPMHYWLELKISGFNDKAKDFLIACTKALKHSQPTAEQFALYKEELKRNYWNKANETPLKQGSELLWKVLYKDYSATNEKLTALASLTYEDLVVFSQNVLDQCYVEAMLYGNLEEEEAKAIWQNFEKVLSSRPYLQSTHPKICLALLPEKEHSSYLLVKSEQPANALILVADCKEFNFKKRAAHEILTKGLEEPFFSELRTRQQTAYLVSNSSQEIERHLYSFFLIQSSSHEARDLLSRFELFLENSLNNLKEEIIPQNRFDSIRNSLVKNLQNPAENLQKMGGILHTLAFDYDGDFSWLDKRIQAFNELDYEEFLQYAHEFLGKENPRRLAILVNGSGPSKGKINYKQVTTPEKIRKQINYNSRNFIVD